MVPRKLKVFRTPIGFHDAYVAAPNQKVAIEAWGSDRDVFRRGEAEQVTEAALTKEPLARPGEVIKRLRGTAEEQLAALPPNRPKRKTPRSPRVPGQDAATKAAPAKPRKQPPRPSRSALHEAEQALFAAKAERESKIAALRKKEEALAGERKRIEQAAGRKLEKLEAKRDRAARAYERAMEKWRAE